MRASSVLIVMLLTNYSLLAQQKLAVDSHTMCSWNEDAINPDSLFSFPPDKVTQAAVDKIMKFTGLQVNFELVAANVPTAVATMQNGKRLILYNQLFMKDVNKDTGTDWSAVSILAHEIGHHLNQHTLGLGGDRSEQELAADKFSGDILFKMGATLDQARAAMESRPETKSPYYPPKAVRLVAIGNGWINAQELANANAPLRGDEKKPDNTAETDAQEKQAAEDRKAKEKADKDEARREEREEREKQRREQAAASRGCYAWGRRFCSLPDNGPIGVSCYCAGVSGYGISGNP
jgi:hypothetical protein